MNELNIHLKDDNQLKKLGKFEHPEFTAKGELRASVKLAELETLWINTGTLCNIECVNCYIESSPKNDRLVYISAAEHEGVLEEVIRLQIGTKEIAYTGGEPFLNPDMVAMARQSLVQGFEVLILTNAMQPMQRKTVKSGLLELQKSQCTLWRPPDAACQSRSLHQGVTRERTGSKFLVQDHRRHRLAPRSRVQRRDCGEDLLGRIGS